MDALIGTYWKELSALIVFVGYTIRQEMITKSNVVRLIALEAQLSSDKTNEWVAFKATTELKLNNHAKEIQDLSKMGGK